MSIEKMGVRAEVFAYAADEIGIWLLGYAFSDEIGTDTDVQAEADLLLHRFGVDRHHVVMIPHGTSCRTFTGSLYATCAAIASPGRAPEWWDIPELPVPTVWPRAQGVTPELIRDFGKPTPHAADQPPVDTRLSDVFKHSLRHLAWLSEQDCPIAEAMSEHWHRHLAVIKPDLYEMYDAPAA